MKLFVVSLQTEPERRKFMMRQLQRLQLPYELIDAVDARLLTREQIKQVNSSREYANEMRPGEIACVMSHRKACLRLIESGERHGIIMEDDVIIGSHFCKLVKEISSAERQHGGVTLFYSAAHGRLWLTAKKQLSDGFCLATGAPPHKVFGTVTYLLSAQTARGLVAGMEPVRSIADDWKRYVENGFIAEVDLVFPFPVLHAEFLGAVQRSDDQTAVRTRVKNFFYRNQIFPFYHLFLIVRRYLAEKRQRTKITPPAGMSGKTYRL